MGNLSPQQQLETDAYVKSIFIKNAIVTSEDVTIATESWKLIVGNKAPGYLELKNNPEFLSTSCLTYFFDSYYAEFFTSDQRSSEIYNKNMHIQGRAMISMMNAVLKMFEDRKTINKKLIDLAQSHHKKGVSTSQYGSLVRGVLSALRKCLGSSFRGVLCEAWYKIFSYILEIVVQKSLEIEKWNSYIQAAGIMVTYISNTFAHPIKDKIITDEIIIDNNSTIKASHKSEGLQDLKVEDIEDEKDNNNNSPNCLVSTNDYCSNKTSRRTIDDNRNHATTSTTTTTSTTVVAVSTSCPFSQHQSLSSRGSYKSVFSTDTSNKTVANHIVTDGDNNDVPLPVSSPYPKKLSNAYSSLTRCPSLKYSVTSSNNENIEVNHINNGNPFSRILNTISHTTTRRIVST